VSSIKKNLVSGSMICRDGYKILLGSNKCIVSKHGTFIGKDYGCRDLFRFFLLNVCNKIMNSINISDELDLWHLHLCHVNLVVLCG
jgi:hypothetical protein